MLATSSIRRLCNLQLIEAIHITRTSLSKRALTCRQSPALNCLSVPNKLFTEQNPALLLQCHLSASPVLSGVSLSKAQRLPLSFTFASEISYQQSFSGIVLSPFRDFTGSSSMLETDRLAAIMTAEQPPGSQLPNELALIVVNRRLKLDLEGALNGAREDIDAYVSAIFGLAQVSRLFRPLVQTALYEHDHFAAQWLLEEQTALHAYVPIPCKHGRRHCHVRRCQRKAQSPPIWNRIRIAKDVLVNIRVCAGILMMNKVSTRNVTHRSKT